MMSTYRYELQVGTYDKCALPNYRHAGFYPSYDEAKVAGKDWDCQKLGLSNYNTHRIIIHELSNEKEE